VAVLRAFADKQAIAFPLLSDEGSHVMRRLGLLNERVQEDHAAYGIKPDPRHTNLPYPGVFVLDEAGVIVAKRFHESYRERDTGAALLAQTLRVLEPRPPRAADFPGPSIVVGAWLDSPTYSFFQRMHLNLELRVAPGFRIGAPATSHGIAPLTVQVAETPGVVAGAAEWPGRRGESTSRTGRGSVDARRHDSWPRASHLCRRSRSGRSRGDGRLSYQLRDDAGRLLPPSSVEVRVGVSELAMVDRTLPVREGI
jgi:Peroxiredoxin